MNPHLDTATHALRATGVPQGLVDTLNLARTDSWPPTPGVRVSPDASCAIRVWARINLAEWLDTAAHAFGPHRTGELAVLAAAGSWLRNAGEGTHILWALDVVEPRYWVAYPHTALAVTELVCIGPELDDRSLTKLDAALTAVGWTPTHGAEPNSTCLVNYTSCHYSAWNDGYSTPQYRPASQRDSA